MKTIRAFNGIRAGRGRSAAVLTAACAIALSGCSSHSDTATTATTATSTTSTTSTASTAPASPPAQAAPQAPAPNLLQIHANEDGQVPVLAFGDIVSGATAPTGAVTAAEFKKDLDWLYAHDYRPVGLKDFATGKIDVPAGKSPVILTFDGGTVGQYRTMPDGSTDPNCALSILESFNSDHPDWALKGAFILPLQDGKTKSEFGANAVSYKLEHLTGDGFDLGCILPASIATMSADKLQSTIATGLGGIAGSGVGPIQVLEVPTGGYPKYVDMLHSGATVVKSSIPKSMPKNIPGAGLAALQSHPMSYTTTCAVTGGDKPSLSSADKKFDPYHIPRITIDGSHPVDVALKSVSDRFVSDGDPTTIAVPASKQNDINAPVLQQLGISVKSYPATVASAH